MHMKKNHPIGPDLLPLETFQAASDVIVPFEYFYMNEMWPTLKTDIIVHMFERPRLENYALATYIDMSLIYIVGLFPARSLMPLEPKYI